MSVYVLAKSLVHKSSVPRIAAEDFKSVHVCVRGQLYMSTFSSQSQTDPITNKEKEAQSPHEHRNLPIRMVLCHV